MARARCRTIWLLIVLLTGGIGMAVPEAGFSQPYVRAGVALDWAEDTRFQDENCSEPPPGSSEPQPLYGCGSGNDGAPKGSLGDFGTMAGLELGLGYIILPALRLEAAVQYRPDFSFGGHANFSQPDSEDEQDVAAELSALTGMLTAYLDIPMPALFLLRYTPINPFIGVGGGLSRIDISETRMDFPTTSTVVPGGRHVSFTWMLSAGLAVWLGGRLTADVAWRYTDYGTIETDSGTGQVIWRDESRKPLDLDLDKTRGELRGHGVTVSLRYDF